VNQPTFRDDVTVLVPAAGRVSEGVLSLSSIACPAMIPVAGRPVVHWTLSYLRSLGLRRFHFAVSRRGLTVEDFVAGSLGGEGEARFFVPSRDGGVGRTLLELLEGCATERALVVLGDTHFTLRDPALLSRTHPTVLVQQVDDSYRWCCAELGAEGAVTALHDKVAELPGRPEALIGVYWLPDVARARSAARAAVAAAEARGERTELAAILRLLQAEGPLYAERVNDWLDVGNPDTQARAHRVLLRQRAFNSLSIDTAFGTIRKESRNVEKFLDEIQYLRALPRRLQVLFPRVLDYSLDDRAPFVELEYYGYPSLADAFVFESLDASVWEEVFRHLDRVLLSGFGVFRRKLPDGAVEEMLLGKTLSRLAGVEGPAPLAALLRADGPITVNGRPLANLPALRPRLEEEVARLARSATGTAIHGDLCFSNVLYDFRQGIVKLIDPRGSFGAAGIYGDPRYDVAKLWHSVHGHYDFIVNDLFRLEVDGTEVKFEICTRPNHDKIAERFARVFFPGWGKRDITLIAAFLFASMPPLHEEAPRRQLAMYVRALQLFHEALGELSQSSP